MWYLKKASEQVWSASKSLLDKRSPTEKLLSQLAESQQQILPTQKLSALASQTFEPEHFDEIFQSIFQKLKKFTYDLVEAQKSLNVLIVTNYLIKHGATGFVDQFRGYVGMFEKYQKLVAKKVYEDGKMQGKLEDFLQRIRGRARHIRVLLQDKEKLLKEKELSMLVKQKLKLYQKNKLSELKTDTYSNQAQRKLNKQLKHSQPSSSAQSPSASASPLSTLSTKAQTLLHTEELSLKLQGLLENYIWKYVDRIDDTLQSASDKVMEKIDQYVLGGGKVPFQMEDEEDEDGDEKHKKEKKQRNKEQLKEQDQDEELMKKLEQEANLLDLQDKDAQHKQANLIDFQQIHQQNQHHKNQKKKAPENEQLI